MVHVVIPAQCFTRAKSRLAGIWSQERRAFCARWMLTRSIQALQTQGWAEAITVLSDDSEVLEFAGELGAKPAADRAEIQGHGAQLQAYADALDDDVALLVLMSDLPLMHPAAIAEFFEHCADHDVVLAPDRHDLGTNAAYFAHRRHRHLHFGHRDSFLRHHKAVRDDARYHVMRAPAFQMDLDSPDDLQAVQRWAQVHAPEDEELARCFWGSHA